MIRTFEVTAQTPTGLKTVTVRARSKASAERVARSRLAANEAGQIKIKTVAQATQ